MLRDRPNGARRSPQFSVPRHFAHALPIGRADVKTSEIRPTCGVACFHRTEARATYRAVLKAARTRGHEAVVAAMVSLPISRFDQAAARALSKRMVCILGRGIRRRADISAEARTRRVSLVPTASNFSFRNRARECALELFEFKTLSV